MALSGLVSFRAPFPGSNLRRSNLPHWRRPLLSTFKEGGLFQCHTFTEIHRRPNNHAPGGFAIAACFANLLALSYEALLSNLVSRQRTRSSAPGPAFGRTSRRRTVSPDFSSTRATLTSRPLFWFTNLNGGPSSPAICHLSPICANAW